MYTQFSYINKINYFLDHANENYDNTKIKNFYFNILGNLNNPSVELQEICCLFLEKHYECILYQVFEDSNRIIKEGLHKYNQYELSLARCVKIFSDKNSTRLHKITNEINSYFSFVNFYGKYRINIKKILELFPKINFSNLEQFKDNEKLEIVLKLHDKVFENYLPEKGSEDEQKFINKMLEIIDHHEYSLFHEFSFRVLAFYIKRGKLDIEKLLISGILEKLNNIIQKFSEYTDSTINILIRSLYRITNDFDIANDCDFPYYTEIIYTMLRSRNDRLVKDALNLLLHISDLLPTRIYYEMKENKCLRFLKNYNDYYLNTEIDQFLDKITENK